MSFFGKIKERVSYYVDITTWSFKSFKHIMTTMHDFSLGRRYIFKDSPDWFVADVASIGRAGIEMEPSSEISEYFKEAIAEEQLRVNRTGKPLDCSKELL